MKDYQTKKGRLTKKEYDSDFRLADNDDFFGFDIKDEQFTFVEIITLGLVIAGLLFVATHIFLSLTPNI